MITGLAYISVPLLLEGGLGRSLRDLSVMLDDLKQRGVKFQSLTEAIDTTTPSGRSRYVADDRGIGRARAQPNQCLVLENFLAYKKNELAQ